MALSKPTHSCGTIVKATDLIKVVNQIFEDRMQYVQVTICYNDFDENSDGELRISAVPSATSSDVKKYPAISPSSLGYFY